MKTGNDLSSLLRPQPTLLDIRMDTERYPRLWTMDQETAVARLGLIVGMAVQYRGQQIDADNLYRMTKALYSELMADIDNIGLRYLTVPEIELVIRRAVSGQSRREMFGVNVASMLQALCDYTRGEGAELQRRVDKRRFLAQGRLKYQQLVMCARIFAANRHGYETDKTE